MRPASIHLKLLLMAAFVVVAWYPARAVSSTLYRGEQADLIVLGEGQATESTAEDGSIVFRIRWDSVLKGEMPTGPSIEATLEASTMGSIVGGRPYWEAEAKKDRPALYGLWFLKRGDDGAHRSVPPMGQWYETRDAVVELPAAWVPQPGDDLERKLLVAARDHFRFKDSDDAAESSEALLLRSLEYGVSNGLRVAAWAVMTELMNSSSERERRVGTAAGMRLTYRDRTTAPLLEELESLEPAERMSLAAGSRDDASRRAALEVVNRLMNSAERGERTIGVVLGLQLHHDAALELLSTNLDSLREDPNFGHILFNLKFLYRRPPRPFEHELWIDPLPSEPDPLAILVDLIERRSGAPGLEDAIAGTLHRMMKRHDKRLARPDLEADKKVLPAAALLLESADPKAKEGGVQLFHVYVVFARPSTVNQRTLFWTEERRRFPDGAGTAPIDERAAFWLQWWSENRVRLGFGPEVPTEPGQGN